MSIKPKTKLKPGATPKPEETPDLESWEPAAERPGLGTRIKRMLIGAPRNLQDKSLFHQLSLVPFLAWVGLGADGLSSSSYGPEEAFRALGDHIYLAIALALAVGLTIFIISTAYSHIIEVFPHGGGGYMVATKLLGERVGVVSGCALLVDYVLTITVSLAAAGDALFSNLPPHWQAVKLPVEVLLVLTLTILNIRGVKESVLAMLPIFLVFLITHVVLIFGSLAFHAGDLPRLGSEVKGGFHDGLALLGMVGMFKLFIHAYSMGGGTYTGLEAVSNGLPIMREPRVPTAKRTMLYMSTSLAFMASGLLVCYLLVKVTFIEGKTLNWVLANKFAAITHMPLGWLFVAITILSEGALLVVGAQAGFIDGPRVLANMAVDSWVPRRFAALSDRLTTQNGILLMGTASMAALLYTHGDVRMLVVMYSINVFLTFSLSMFGMLRHWFQVRHECKEWKQRIALFTVGFLLCITILIIVTIEKFPEGGWITVAVTSLCVALCFMIRKHYRNVSAYLREFDKSFTDLPLGEHGEVRPLSPAAPTAGIMVGGYGGTGIHLILNILKAFPNYFQNIIFLSVGVIDSGQFKGEAEMEALRGSTEKSLQRYVDLARKLGFPATYKYAVGTDVVDESEKLCREVAREFPRTTFFSGQVVFQQEKWFHRLLHNQTSFNIQKRLHWSGLTMVILPMRVRR